MGKVNIELTDTFGGEANYSWVRRYTIEERKTELATIREAKRILGLSGIRCRKLDFGDSVALYPVGSCTVAFISWGVE